MIYFWHQSAAPWGRHPMQTAVLWLCWCRGGEGNPTDSDQSNPAIQIKKNNFHIWMEPSYLPATFCEIKTKQI